MTIFYVLTNLLKNRFSDFLFLICFICSLFILKDIKYYSNSIILVLISPILYIFYKKAFYINKGKISLEYTFTPAILFSIFTVIGKSFDDYGSLNSLIGSPTLIFNTILNLLGYFSFFFCIINLIFYKINSPIKKNKAINFKKNKLLSLIFYEKPLLFSWIIIFTLWLPYLIASYPGRFLGDTLSQLQQFFGIGNPTQWQQVILIDPSMLITQHHPVFHTVFLGSCVYIGRILYSDNFGMFIYTFIQYITISFSFAFAFWYIVKIKSKDIIKFFAILFFSFFPLFPMMSTLATKDGLFSAFMLIFSIFYIQIIANPESILKVPKRFLCFFIITILCFLSRNNGIYSIIISFLVLIILFRKNIKVRKFLIYLTLSTLALFFSYTNILLPMFKISKGSIREVLSVPFQQTARYLRDHGDDVKPYEHKAINKVLDYDKLASLYDPLISDPVKQTFKKLSTKKDLLHYFNVWFRMFLRHPLNYLNAFIHNTYGYVYCSKHPFYFYPLSENHPEMIGEGFNIIRPKITQKIASKMDKFIDFISSVPLIELLFSSGIYSYFLILISFLLFYKNKKYFFTCVPSYTLLLTCFLSPVNGNIYSRYTLPIIFIIPILSAICFKILKIKY